VNDTWYFAYGSNLLVDQKEQRTRSIRSAVRCRLPAYRFAFNKRPGSDDGAYANIVPDTSASVWGVAYLCDEAAIIALDSYEGVSDGHYRHEDVQVVTDAGDVLQALTYVAGDDFVCEQRRPRGDYLDRILVGARHHGLPEDYIEVLETLGGGPNA
jgi:gamma-glutamylcyclotransferase